MRAITPPTNNHLKPVCYKSGSAVRTPSLDRITILPTHKVKKVLLLQGPVGPFFKNLQTQLEANGIDTKRISFHAADAFFSCRAKTAPYKGHASEWDQQLRAELEFGNYDCVVLFGSERPAHLIANQIAEEAGCPVISLEEGYLRTGFISCELNGNNAKRSSIGRWRPTLEAHKKPTLPLETHKSTLGVLAFWAAVYYFIREIRPHSGDAKLHHRETSGIIKESISWAHHYMRRKFAKYAEHNLIKSLVAERKQPFILVPLQVPSDMQMQKHARGWSNEKLISHCLKSLRNCRKKQVIVFKTHPLDQHSHELVNLVKRQAKALGVLNKVYAIQSGNLSELTQHSSGMIVINSTSAFSALHHDKPLLVLGDAIYRHDEIVTLGNLPGDISTFLQFRAAKPADNVKKFIHFVKSHALVAGDFYRLSTQTITAVNVVERIQELVEARVSDVEARRKQCA